MVLQKKNSINPDSLPSTFTGSASGFNSEVVIQIHIPRICIWSYRATRKARSHFLAKLILEHSTL